MNQLFRLISMYCNGYKNEIPTKNDEDYRVVAKMVQLSNFELIQDIAKVVDYIERCDLL